MVVWWGRRPGAGRGQRRSLAFRPSARGQTSHKVSSQNFRQQLKPHRPAVLRPGCRNPHRVGCAHSMQSFKGQVPVAEREREWCRHRPRGRPTRRRWGSVCVCACFGGAVTLAFCRAANDTFRRGGAAGRVSYKHTRQWGRREAAPRALRFCHSIDFCPYMRQWSGGSVRACGVGKRGGGNVP